MGGNCNDIGLTSNNVIYLPKGSLGEQGNVLFPSILKWVALKHFLNGSNAASRTKVLRSDPE